MAVACGAHILHDGFTGLLYVLLFRQAEFGLGYAEIGLLRALYVGAMAGFQMPAGALAQRFGGPLVLGLGTVASRDRRPGGRRTSRLWPLARPSEPAPVPVSLVCAGCRLLP
jgi:hypothetical protein